MCWAVRLLLVGVLLVGNSVLGAEEYPGPLDWPRKYKLDNGGSLLLYQPQFERWTNGLELRGAAVIAYDRSNESRSLLGTLIFDASTESDVASNLVRIHNIRLLESAFSGLSFKDSKILTGQLTGLFPKQIVMSIDQVLAGVRRGGEQPSREARQDSPAGVLVSQASAILLQFSGEPEWRAIEGLDLQVATNTDSNLFYLEKKNKFYLLDGEIWLQAASVSGPWSAATKLPKSITKLGEVDESWSEVVAAVPAKRISDDQVPDVIIATQPSELVVIEGEPETEAIPESDLLWVTNTDNDLFVYGPDLSFLLLATGRWYRAEALEGPWILVDLAKLPSTFGLIPRQHAKANVLSFVPGTPEAIEASIRAQIPQQTTLSVGSDVTEVPDFVVEGDNDLIAGLDGQVYRRDGEGWVKYVSDGWSPAPPAKEPERDPSTGKIKWGPDTLKNANRSRVYNLLEWDYLSRERGATRAREAAKQTGNP